MVGDNVIADVMGAEAAGIEGHPGAGPGREGQEVLAGPGRRDRDCDAGGLKTALGHAPRWVPGGTLRQVSG